ncbi:MAG: hypothetical protein KAU94_09245 [Verrucomicrobia bacterium]|nr:hypothetical protein [Verrucomicrobiota bacterium]
MIDDLTTEEEQSTIFESFSDVALCTLAVALLLVTLLAINITQNLDVQINRNTFSGGVMRPSFHLECTVPDFSATTVEELAVERALFAGTPYVAVHLFSPSLALIATDVREGGTVALGEDETFAQQQDLSLYQFMRLVPGIDPGSFEVAGQKTALLLPSILDKQMVYEPNSAEGYRANADRRLTKRMLTQLWPVYSNPTYPARRPEDYSQARTRIFVESKTVEGPAGEEHHIVIGHSVYKVPEALDDGSLAWLGGFSSGLTEMVFLGETWSDAGRRTNKRIEFFEKAGYDACAAAYREYAFPSQDAPELEPVRETLRQLGYPEGRIEQRARDAIGQRQASAALLTGNITENRGGFLPPLLAHPDAWAAYIRNGQKNPVDPPKWFYSDFLDKLGFDRLTIERASP